MIEYRDLPAAALPTLRSALYRAIRGHSAIAWVDLNPRLHCVVFAADASEVELATLSALVERCEQVARAHAVLEPGVRVQADDAHVLPDDALEVAQQWVQLWADVAGLGYGMILRLVPFAPAKLGSRAVLLLSLVQSTPRLRRPLDARLGPERTDLFLSLCLSWAQGLSQRPLSSAVDIARRASALRELLARRRVYAQLRERLLREPVELSIGVAQAQAQRPVPQPPGPIDDYLDRAWLPPLAAFSVGFVTTRRIDRATAAMFGALPRPAKLGREMFATELGRALAERGMLVLCPRALRCLDRVDTIVIDRALLTRTRFSVGAIEPLATQPVTELRARAHALLDPREPLALRRKAGYQLAPLARTSIALTARACDKALEIQQRGSLVLALSTTNDARGAAHGAAGQPLALIELRIATHPGAERLVELARQANMDVALCGDADPDGAVPIAGVELLQHDTTAEAVRALQRRGRTVCLMAATDDGGLAVADCSVAVARPGFKPPLSAHVLCSEDLDDLLLLLRATLIARSVSEQSVRVARATAVVNTVVASGAKRRIGHRVMFVASAASLATMFNALHKIAALRSPPVSARPTGTPYHALETLAVLSRLGSSYDGLSEAEAARRVRSAAGAPNLWRELGHAIQQELDNPLTPFMAAGAGLSALVGSGIDAGLVAGAGLFGGLLAGGQRVRTERALRSLVRPARQPVNVVRAGRRRVLADDEVVVGDVVLLRAGDVVPADCRILESSALEVDSASLTGESLPSAKSAGPSFEANLADRSSMLYAGTTVVGGRARAVAIAVGGDVEALRAAGAKHHRRRDSGVEARLRQLTQLTLPVATAGAAAVMLSGALRGLRPQDLISSGVSMGVAALPEGLPLLATAAQLATAERLTRHGALVRNPRCIEALGRVDVVCIDKTGTLTAGLIELSTVVCPDRTELTLDALDATGRSVLAAALRATPHRESGNTTDAATERAAGRVQVDRQLDAPGFERTDDYPFASAHGYHAVVAHSARDVLLALKGAAERVLPHCSQQWLSGERTPLDDAGRDAILAQAKRLAAQGLRVIAVAERRVPLAARDDTLRPREPRELCFMGLLGFRDPVRANAKLAVEKLRQAGVRVVMLTGDHIETARNIARSVGLSERDDALTGGPIALMNDAELAQRMQGVELCARVTPAQKVRIVRALQERGHVVAMVGDGANDAPAMHTAEVGIAVGQTCAHAAQVAADILFADASIDSLLEGIVDARAMWLSIRDAASILLGGNLGEIGFVSVTGFVSGRPPLNPRQLLLVNLLTDIAPAMAVALRAPPKDVFDQLQRTQVDALLGQPLDSAILVRAASTALGAGWAWGVGRATGSHARASTMALTALIGAQLGQTLLSRGSDRSVVVTAAASAIALAAIVQTPGVSHVLGCRPLGPFAWATALSASAGATVGSVALASLEQHARTWLEQWLRNHAKARDEHDVSPQAARLPAAIAERWLPTMSDPDSAPTVT